MRRKVAIMRLVAKWLALLCSISFASPANDKVQEGAYILSVEKDTAKAKELFNFALNYPDAAIREKLSANLYLAKIAEAMSDTPGVMEHYGFLKNNSQNISLAYMAASKEKLFGAPNEKVKISGENFFY
jgi:hypothetical protein